MKIGRGGNTALCTGAAYTAGRTLLYASFISTEQVGNQIKATILLGHNLDLTTDGRSFTVYPSAGFGAALRTLPMSIYTHYILISNDPALALLLDPAHPAPGDPHYAEEDARKRDEARTLAQADRLHDYHKLVAQVANNHVDAPILPEWIPTLFKTQGLADPLTCHGDALHGCLVRPGNEWNNTVKKLLQQGKLPWPQEPITVTKPENMTYATAGTSQTRLLPNPA